MNQTRDQTMKNAPAAAPIYTLLISLVLAAACSRDPLSIRFHPAVAEADDRMMADSAKAEYRFDAAALVLREELHRGSRSLELPAERTGSLYSALVHLYNARHLAARDTVTRQLNIHAAPAPDPRRIIVEFDSSAAWAADWQQGRRETGNADLDFLLETYDISIPVYYFWGGTHAACLQSGSFLNTSVLAGMFADIEGIHASRLFYRTGGTDITARAGPAHWDLSFSAAPEQIWNFRVYRDGSVFFTGRAGP